MSFNLKCSKPIQKDCGYNQMNENNNNESSHQKLESIHYFYTLLCQPFYNPLRPSGSPVTRIFKSQ